MAPFNPIFKRDARRSTCFRGDASANTLHNGGAIGARAISRGEPHTNVILHGDYRIFVSAASSTVASVKNNVIGDDRAE